MRAVFIKISIGCLGLFLVTCDSPGEEKALYSVSGLITQNGISKVGASVSIDGKLNYSTLSAADGSFIIEDVPEGDHDLIVKSSLDDGSFVESTNEISVHTDVYFESLILPLPVSMHDPVNISGTAIALKWDQSSAADFREYKIYRHTTPGLDETTGTLAYVTVNRLDTLYTDENLDPLTTYYYRVFVMNEYGRIGGSNISSGTTLNRNLIHNGDFELNEDPTTWWLTYHYGTVINQTDESHLGERALYMNADSIFAGWDCYYATVISGQILDLMPGNRYRLSLWIKTSGYTYPRWADFSIGAYGDVMAGIANYGDIGMFGIPGNSDWTYVEKVFDMTEITLQQRTIQLISSSEHAWFDDIRLELVE